MSKLEVKKAVFDMEQLITGSRRNIAYILPEVLGNNRELSDNFCVVCLRKR